MNHALLVSGDFVRIGGMDMANYALAEHLAKRDVKVHLVAFRVADTLLEHSNVSWRRVVKPLNSYFLASPLLAGVGKREGRKALDRGGRVIVNGGNCRVGDVNWVHYVHAAYSPVASGSALRRSKAIAAHALSVREERKALKMARIIIANSNSTRRELIERVGVDEARIRTVYIGVDAEKFTPPDESRRTEARSRLGWRDSPQVAFVGALSDRRKGFDTLFEAWRRLCGDPAWDCDLNVIGQGAELEAWRARAKETEMRDRIRFLGFRRDVPDVLAACDALVAPTRYEPFGLGVQEALCTGLPALVSANAGVAELYPAGLSDLLLQEPTNPMALESALRFWRRHHERFQAEARKISVSLREHSWEKMAEKIHALIS